MDIKFLKCNEGAIIPSKRDEDAAFDLYAIGADDGGIFENNTVFIKPGQTIKFNTGLKAIIPSDVWVLLKERSSTAKTGLSIRSGVIDSGYRGEWCIMMTNCGCKNIVVTNQYDGKPDIFITDKKNEDGSLYNYWIVSFKKAIAQAVVMPKLNVTCSEIDAAEFAAAPQTVRGEGGWGASGK